MTALKTPAQPKPEDEVDRGIARPDFMILGYPVAVARPPLINAGSFINLMGDNASEERKNAYSADLLVKAGSPPAFFVHADNDPSVPVGNSIVMKEALERSGVSAELLRHPTGGHGFGMGPAAGYLDAPDWMPKLQDWMKRQGLLG